MIKKLMGRVPDLGDVIKRFPVAVLAMAIFTLIWIIFPNYKLSDEIGRALVGLVVGGYLCVMITVAREGVGRSKLYLLQLAIVVVLGVMFYFSESLRLNIFMAIGAVLLALGNAVGWKQTRDDMHVWDFTHKIWTGAVMATVGSIIFLLGLLAIMGALKSLLGVDIESLITELLMPIGFGFLAPLYWLSTVPPVDEPYEELYDNPGFISKAIGFLGTWLLAPLTLIYAAIILLYGVKILFAWELPKGEIATLTTPFLIIGALTWLVLEPPFIQKAVIARWFRKLWFPVSIPVAVMLAVAVNVRIREYGFTEERFALMLAVVWALGVGLWFTVGPRAKRDIRIVPAVGAGLLLLGTFVALPLSIANQTQRAHAMVSELGIVNSSGDITALKTPTKEQILTVGKLKGQLKYLYKRKAYKSVGALFPNFEDVKDQTKLYQALEIDTIYVNRRTGVPSVKFNGHKNFVDVKGFDHISGVFSQYNYNRSNHKQKPYVLSHKDAAVKVERQSGLIVVTHADGHVATVDLEVEVLKLKRPYEAPLVIDVDGRTRIQIISFKMSEDINLDEIGLTQVNFYVLTRDGAATPSP